MTEMPQNNRVNFEIAIGGMTCAACSTSITNAIKAMQGVKSVDVSLITERAVITAEGISANQLVEAIEDCGFDAEVLKINSNANKSPNHQANNLTKIEVAVGGMTCSSCSNTIKDLVGALEYVQNVGVSLATDTAYIDAVDLTEERVSEILSTIEDAGFDAKVEKKINMESSVEKSSSSNGENSTLELSLFGVDEHSNYPLIESKILDLNGVNTVDIDRITHKAVIKHNRNLIGIRAISRALESMGISGISAILADNSHQMLALSRVKELQKFYNDTIKTLVLGLPVFILLKFRDYLPHFLTAKLTRGIWLDDVLSLALVVPIILGPARGFYLKSFKALKARSPTMDVLVSVSVTSAFIYSIIMLLYSIISGTEKHKMYLWDACAMILVFVLFGKYLENMARGQTTRALAELISLFPESALVIAEDTSADGDEMPVDMLQHSDVVVLRPGEKVSADGTVISGESFVTESLITGESKPVRKTVGDRVYGGTANGLGSLKFKVTECGSDTKLSQIVQFVKDAQALRVPIQRYTDSISAKFVPGVLLLSLITFAGWSIAGLILGVDKLPHMFKMDNLFVIAFRLAISVVVVACPCALGLATPTAVMVGTGVGAKHGILIKGGGVFELGSQASVVLFDKTGTLTLGNVMVTSTNIPAEYWPAIRAIERQSEHVIGRALANYSHPLESGDQKQIEVLDFQTIVGVGVEAKINNMHYFIGQHESEGICLVIDNAYIGKVNVEDAVRSDSYDVADKLQRQGYQVGIVSGDSQQAVELIAKELQIDPEYTWPRMKPEDKVEVVENLKREGKTVVFVGDGVNDSPALAVSSVGISLEGATHVAVESADVVLTQASPIAAVPAVLDLCKCTMRRIKMNLFSSIFYNAIMIPFAMGLFLHFNWKLSPVMASAAMAMSSVSVVFSSLMLRSWQPEPLNPLNEPVKPSIWTRLANKVFFWKSRGVEYVPV